MRLPNPIDFALPSTPSYRLNPARLRANPTRPEVSAPYSVVPETPRIRAQGGGWFQHWSVLGPDGKKLKGAVMVRQEHGRHYTTTYRDGIHVRGLRIDWLLTQQQ
jgi:hypothetical protein